ncbi:hypothetical protein BGZ49_002952 [Haplosporangium sp. Z 27]|nr:hypothetical protein BGZ49_002952 [Haplosporangium sp. Z 27]
MANEIKLFCIIDGESTPISIKIRTDETVDDIKKAIKKEKAIQLADIDADKLDLWKVSIPSAPKRTITLDNLEEEDKTELDDSTTEISELFGQDPPKKAIHIIIERPVRDVHVYLRPFDGISTEALKVPSIETLNGLTRTKMANVKAADRGSMEKSDITQVDLSSRCVWFMSIVASLSDPVQFTPEMCRERRCLRTQLGTKGELWLRVNAERQHHGIHIDNAGRIAIVLCVDTECAHNVIDCSAEAYSWFYGVTEAIEFVCDEKLVSGFTAYHERCITTITRYITEPEHVGNYTMQSLETSSEYAIVNTAILDSRDQQFYEICVVAAQMGCNMNDELVVRELIGAIHGLNELLSHRRFTHADYRYVRGKRLTRAEKRLKKAGMLLADWFVEYLLRAHMVEIVGSAVVHSDHVGRFGPIDENSMVLRSIVGGGYTYGAIHLIGTECSVDDFNAGSQLVLLGHDIADWSRDKDRGEWSSTTQMPFEDACIKLANVAGSKNSLFISRCLTTSVSWLLASTMSGLYAGSGAAYNRMIGVLGLRNDTPTLNDIKQHLRQRYVQTDSDGSSVGDAMSTLANDDFVEHLINKLGGYTPISVSYTP